MARRRCRRLWHGSEVIFGPAVTPAPTTEVADWIAGLLRRGGSVGSLVPTVYEAYLEVEPPAAGDADDWWPSYRELFGVIAAIGATRTTTPDRCWYAIWEGHGFGTGALGFFSVPGVERDRRAEDAIRAEFEERNAATRAALAELPRFAVPSRTYFLLGGDVAAATELQWAGETDQWFRPDLWWPDDRSWFVATDVDFWCLYVGGPASLIAELAEALPTVSRVVSADAALDCEAT